MEFTEFENQLTRWCRSSESLSWRKSLREFYGGLIIVTLVDKPTNHGGHHLVAIMGCLPAFHVCPGWCFWTPWCTTPAPPQLLGKPWRTCCAGRPIRPMMRARAWQRGPQAWRSPNARLEVGPPEVMELELDAVPSTYPVFRCFFGVFQELVAIQVRLQREGLGRQRGCKLWGVGLHPGYLWHFMMVWYTDGANFVGTNGTCTKLRCPLSIQVENPHGNSTFQWLSVLIFHDVLFIFCGKSRGRGSTDLKLWRQTTCYKWWGWSLKWCGSIYHKYVESI